MDIQFTYQKKRSEFGRQCLFSDKGPELIDNYPSNKKLINNYILKDPVYRHTQCAPIQAEQFINTERAEYSNAFMNHVEGGWPKDVNLADEEQPKRYRRKVEKEENYHHTMMHLFKNMEGCILQNNAINIYQQYFSDVEPTPLIERSSARTVNRYQDQSAPTRPVTHISWSPDNFSKLTVSHCNLNFQQVVPNQATYSYVWEVENPNTPLMVLRPEHPSVCLEYNPKDANNLASGQFNGQVAIWDIRKGNEPVELSVIENSHRDPVLNVLWINSKSGTEFFSSSTDGQVKWWDTRKLSEPTETLMLDISKDEQNITNAMGASSLEYEMTIPTRFMVGTEQGVVISCNRKGKTPQEKMSYKFFAHLGPVLALQRNPAFVKNFLTVGDWTAKIWAEDCRESAIIWTKYHNALITDGAWSPVRLSVFFTTRSDGILDAWDILQQQEQACVGMKVCDEPLKCLRAHELGRLVAVGNQIGSTYLVEFSENLASSNRNDKMLLTAMFERENKREKILEARNRELKLKQKAKSKSNVNIGEERQDSRMSIDFDAMFENPAIAQTETEFHQVIKEETQGPEDITPEEETTEVEEISEVTDDSPDTQVEQPKKKKKKKGKKDKKKGKGKKRGKSRERDKKGKEKGKRKSKERKK